ncbi:MAG: hypothetical protein R2911_03815 [Caldilineaceae bacterium]
MGQERFGVNFNHLGIDKGAQVKIAFCINKVDAGGIKALRDIIFEWIGCKNWQKSPIWPAAAQSSRQ